MTRTEAEAASTSHIEPRTIDVQAKIYYDLHTPQQDDASPSPLLVALHGYGSNKGRMMRDARQCVPDGFAVAALQGFHQHLKEPREPGGALRYGFGWLTNFHPEDSVALHHAALLQIIRPLVAERVADPARIFLLGFSQTCALNYRFAFTHREVLRGCIGICGGLPGDWETSELYSATDASILHLAGTGDEFYPPARVSGYAAQLQTRSPDVEFKAYDAGHELTAGMCEDVRAWLAARA